PLLHARRERADANRKSVGRWWLFLWSRSLSETGLAATGLRIGMSEQQRRRDVLPARPRSERRRQWQRADEEFRLAPDGVDDGARVSASDQRVPPSLCEHGSDRLRGRLAQRGFEPRRGRAALLSTERRSHTAAGHRQ